MLSIEKSLFSCNAKMPCNYEKSATTAVSSLISLAAASTYTSCQLLIIALLLWFLSAACSTHSLAFVTSKRTLISSSPLSLNSEYFGLEHLKMDLEDFTLKISVIKLRLQGCFWLGLCVMLQHFFSSQLFLHVGTFCEGQYVLLHFISLRCFSQVSPS